MKDLEVVAAVATVEVVVAAATVGLVVAVEGDSRPTMRHKRPKSESSPTDGSCLHAQPITTLITCSTV